MINTGTAGILDNSTSTSDKPAKKKWAIVNASGNVMRVRETDWSGTTRVVKCRYETRDQAREHARLIRARGNSAFKIVNWELVQKSRKAQSKDSGSNNRDSV